MITTVRKKNNEKLWEQFVKDAKSYGGATLWYLTKTDGRLMKHSWGGVIDVFDVERKAGNIEHIVSVLEVTDDSVKVLSEPY